MVRPLATAACASLAVTVVLATGGCRDRRSFPRDATVRAVVTPDSGSSVGDAIALELTASWPERLGVARLVWRCDRDSLIVVAADSLESKAPAGFRSEARRLSLIVPRAGAARIPSAALVSPPGDTLAVSVPIRVSITGRIPHPDPTQLAPLAPMVGLRGWAWVWIVGGAMLACAAAAWSILRFRRRRAALATGPPPIPPGEEFDRALERLLRGGIPERGPARVFVQEISWIFRRYLGRRWMHPALEATRPEIIRWLPDVSLPIQERNRVAAWLGLTDQIKFAGYEPAAGETREIVSHAREMVTTMEVQARADAESPAGGDAQPDGAVSGPTRADSKRAEDIPR